MQSKKTIAFAVLTLLLAAVAVYFWLRGQGSLNARNAGNGESAINGQMALRPDARLTGAPTRTRVDRAAASTPEEKSLATLRQALAQSVDLMKFRDSLNGMTDLTPQDRLYYAAAIDEFCYGASARAGWSDATKIYDWGEGNPLDIPSKAWTNEKKVAASQPNDPKKASRDYASKLQEANSSASLCAGYRASPVKFADIMRRYRAAADAGDPRAIAMLADIALREAATPIDWSKINNRSGKPLPDMGNEVAVPTADYTAKLTAALSTRDPSAILSIETILGQSYRGGEYTFGGEALHPGLKTDMWKLIACEFGAPCTSNNSQILLRACAVDGLCEIPDLESYFLSYRFSQAEADQYLRLRPLALRAIQTGEWSFMQFQSNVGLPPGATQRTSFANAMRRPATPGR